MTTTSSILTIVYNKACFSYYGSEQPALANIENGRLAQD